jgi:hypothetical protein
MSTPPPATVSTPTTTTTTAMHAETRLEARADATRRPFNAVLVVQGFPFTSYCTIPFDETTATIFLGEGEGKAKE